MTDRTICENCLKEILKCECPSRSLLPPLAIAEVQKVLKFGAEKHSPHGWRENDEMDDWEAAERHLYTEDLLDHESNLHPLAHAICRLMFILERELEEDK